MTPNVIAIQGQLNTAGAIIFWRLSGSTAIDALRESLQQVGIADKLLPTAITMNRALSRAVKVIEDARRIARPLPGNIGYAIVEEEIVEKSISPQVAAEFKIIGDRPVCSPDTYTLAAKVFAEYDVKLQNYESVDMSGWLSAVLLPRIRAVALRDSGGVYFIPREYVAEYATVTTAISRVSSHTFFQIPALKSEEAIAAILDALGREITADVSAIEDEIDNQDLPARSLAVRKKRCESLLEKCGAYEGLLGDGMKAIVERAEALKIAIVEAALVADMPREIGGVS